MTAETAKSPSPTRVSRFTLRIAGAGASCGRLVASRSTMDEGDPEQVPGDANGEPRPGSHPRPEAVSPADRDDRDAVAAPPREEDDLDVEDDARDLLPTEQVVSGGAGEALEPALRVLDGADYPGGREDVEGLAEEPPVARLAGSHVGTVGLDARAECDVVIAECLDEQRQLVGRGRHVSVGEDDQVRLRVEHAGTDGGALAAVRHRDHPQVRTADVGAGRSLGSG